MLMLFDIIELIEQLNHDVVYLLALSDDPIWSIEVPQLHSFPPNLNPMFISISIWLLNLWSTISHNLTKVQYHFHEMLTFEYEEQKLKLKIDDVNQMIVLNKLYLQVFHVHWIRNFILNITTSKQHHVHWNKRFFHNLF